MTARDRQLLKDLRTYLAWAALGVDRQFEVANAISATFDHRRGIYNLCEPNGAYNDAVKTAARLAAQRKGGGK